MAEFITTREWGANETKNATPQSHPIDPNPGVTLHWTGNGYGWPWVHERCYVLVRDIERSHEYGNGWGDIAYNFLPCPHGYIFEGRGLNVRSSANGNAARNLARYAVCYLGGASDKFTDDGEQAIRDAVSLLHDRGGARLDVNGHRDGWSTACPGDDIYRWLNRVDWTNLEDDDMPTVEEIVDGLMKATVDNEGTTVKKALRRGSKSLDAVRNHAKRNRAKIAQAAGITPEQLDAVVEELAKIEVQVTVDVRDD